MGPGGVLDVVLTVALIVLVCGSAYGVYELVLTLRSFRRLTDDLDSRVPVLVEDINVSVQALNLQIMRIDAVLEHVEHWTDTVEESAAAAKEAVHVPMAKAAEYAEKARRFLAGLRER